MRSDACHGKGFTLVELLVALAIFATLALAAIPAYGDWRERARVRSASAELSGSLALARIRAIESQASITLCPSHDARACSSDSNWSRGWIVFRDAREIRIPPAAGELLERVQRDPADDVRITSNAGRHWLTYRADGSSSGSNATLVICAVAARSPARRVIVSNVGRVRIQDAMPGEVLCR